MNLRGDTFLKATITFDYNFYKKLHLITSANIANVGDNLFEDNKWVDAIDYSGYALGFGADTFLGPVEIKYSYSSRNREKRLVCECRLPVLIG